MENRQSKEKKTQQNPNLHFWQVHAAIDFLSINMWLWFHGSVHGTKILVSMLFITVQNVSWAEATLCVSNGDGVELEFSSQLFNDMEASSTRTGFTFKNAFVFFCFCFPLSRHLVFKNKNEKFPRTYRRYFEIVSSTRDRVLQAVGRCLAIAGKGFVTAAKMAQCNEVELPLNITVGYKVNKRKKMSPDASRPQCSREQRVETCKKSCWKGSN